MTINRQKIFAPIFKVHSIKVALGTNMNPDSIRELMNIANCGIRRQFPAEIRYREVKAHWWSRKTKQEPYEYTPAPEYYSLDDSLAAIQALGESGNSEALEFLEKLSAPAIEHQSERYFVSGGSEPRDDDWKYFITISVEYPNTQRELYDALKYTVSTRDIYEDDDDDYPEEDFSAKLEHGELPPPESAKAHIVLQTAITTLKQSLAA